MTYTPEKSKLRFGFACFDNTGTTTTTVANSSTYNVRINAASTNEYENSGEFSLTTGDTTASGRITYNGSGTRKIKFTYKCRG